MNRPEHFRQSDCQTLQGIADDNPQGRTCTKENMKDLHNNVTLAEVPDPADARRAQLDFGLNRICLHPSQEKQASFYIVEVSADGTS